MTPRALLGCGVAVWLASAVLVAHPFRAADIEPAQKPTTTNDGVYTKAQADKAKAQFDKICADCHPFTVAAKKKPKDVLLGDDPFYDNWAGRQLAQMITTIALTMPNDGSATVSDEEAADLAAYILQQNGFRPGKQPLTKATASAVIERPNK